MKATAYFVWLYSMTVMGAVQAAPCPVDEGVSLQVLGSGGPELDDGRASSGYLIRIDGRARILVDMGGGSLHRFEQAGAEIEDLDWILLSHLHVDHSADLPQLIKASYFSRRQLDLPIYGPTGNDWMPGVKDYLDALFDEQGAYRYLSDYLHGREAYRLLPYEIDHRLKEVEVVVERPDFRITSVAVHHGPIPALAWRVDIGPHSVVFSGDMSNRYSTLERLADGADLLVAHHAIPETASGVARNLHMPPSVIGAIAAKADIGVVLLSHRMRRTYGVEEQSTQEIRKRYRGELLWAEDLACYPLV